MKRVSTILATALVMLAIVVLTMSAFLNSSAHIWSNEINYRIVYANEESPTCGLYFSRGGDLLIDLRGKGDALYVINPTYQDIGMPNESDFYVALGYAYSKAITPRTVSMNNSFGKLDVNPKLIVEPYSVTFTSAKNVRVQVNWWLNR